MKIGIISDTHNLLRPEVIQNLQGCDMILHAGDSVLWDLKQEDSQKMSEILMQLHKK